MWWRAYEHLEPFGAVREDERIGKVLALYANSHKGKRDKMLHWYDFLPNANKPEPKVSSVREATNVFQKFNERFKE